MAAIAARALHLEGKIGTLNKAFTELGAKAALVGGSLAVLGGYSVIRALDHLANKGSELVNQQEQLRRMGISLGDVNQRTAEYFDKVAAAIPTAKASEYLKTIRELRGAIGDLGTAEAAAMAPQALRVQALLENTTKGDQSGAFWRLLRSEEMKGIITDKAKREAFIEATVPWILGTGGKITPGGFESFARRGGAAWINADLQKSLPGIAVSIADLSGPTAGQSMMSLYQLMMGTMTLSRQQADVLERIGMLDISKTTKTGFGGSRRQLEPGAITGSLEHTGDLPGWIRDVLMPAVRAEAGGDKALEEALLAKIAPNRNAVRMAMMLGEPGFLAQIQKDVGITRMIRPEEELYKQYIRENPQGAQKAFFAQWESMWQALGKPIAEMRADIQVSLIPLFEAIGSFAIHHPNEIKMAAEVIAGLAAGLAILGSVAVVAGLTALAGTGGLIAAFAGTIATLVVLNWDS